MVHSHWDEIKQLMQKPSRIRTWLPGKEGSSKAEWSAGVDRIVSGLCISVTTVLGCGNKTAEIGSIFSALAATSLSAGCSNKSGEMWMSACAHFLSTYSPAAFLQRHKSMFTYFQERPWHLWKNSEGKTFINILNFRESKVYIQFGRICFINI